MYIWPSHIAKSKVVSLHQWAPNLSTADLTSFRWLKYFFIGLVALVHHHSSDLVISLVFGDGVFKSILNAVQMKMTKWKTMQMITIMKKTLQKAGYLSWPPSNIWLRHRPQHEEAARQPVVICVAPVQTKTQTRIHTLKHKLLDTDCAIILTLLKKLLIRPLALNI